MFSPRVVSTLASVGFREIHLSCLLRVSSSSSRLSSQSQVADDIFNGSGNEISSSIPHVPVMAREVISMLDPQPGTLRSV
jgi:hypothetical protein